MHNYVALLLALSVTLCAAQSPHWQRGAGQDRRDDDTGFRGNRRTPQWQSGGVERPTTATPRAAGYPAAGFRPDRAFDLPTEPNVQDNNSNKEDQRLKPAARYGPPSTANKPHGEYGAPTLNKEEEEELAQQPQDFNESDFNQQQQLQNEEQQYSQQSLEEADEEEKTLDDDDNVAVADEQVNAAIAEKQQPQQKEQQQLEQFDIPFALLLLPQQYVPISNV